MFCTNCGRYKGLAHRCPPAWQWREKGDEEWFGERVFAHDAEDAAIGAAAIYDRDDSPLARGSEAILQVRREGDAQIHTFDVRGYITTEYVADEINDDDEH